MSHGEKRAPWSRYPGEGLLIEGSLWSADHAHFAREMERIDPFVDMYHVDVSDDHFVPGLLFFPDLLASLRPLTRRPFHVHLMVENPRRLIDDFARAGADLITVHCENGPLVSESLRQIRENKAAPGIALGLQAPVEALTPHLSEVDLVLLMGTPMGIKGIDLSPGAADRIRSLRHLLADRGVLESVKIVADGGIRAGTVEALRAAGADILVAGSLLFKSTDRAATSTWLRALQTESL